MKSPRIGFLTNTDPGDKRSWSGIHFAMLNQLQQQFDQVIVLGPIAGGTAQKAGKIRNRIGKLLTGKRFDYSHSKSLAKHYAKEVERKIEETKPDIIIAPSGSTLVAELKTTIPYILLSDTTFARMVDYYESYTGLNRRSLLESNATETSAFQHAAALVFPSQWAVDSAIKDHGANPKHVHCIPFGANFTSVPERAIALREKDRSCLRLLFLGVDWKRKGGELVLETMEEIRKQGILTELTIVGCSPEIEKKEHITIVPFVNKNDPKGEKTIQDLLIRSDFLFLPSQSECYGIVFCEASACGTPSVTRNTGGIEGAVKNGINGFRLDENATAKEYAEKIISVYNDQTAYETLRKSSRDLFEQTHNWNSWGKSMKVIIETILNKHQA